MKIKIKTEDVKLNLWIPTSLISCRFIWSNIIKHACKEEDININPEQMDIIFKALQVSVKQYKGLKLVDVHTKDGETIKIVL